MNINKMPTDQLIMELDALRVSQNFSYQNVADACNVSQATIMRVLKRQTEPTLELLQKIASAVGYEPEREELVLKAYTQDAYVEFLQKSISVEKEEHKLRESRAEARHNMMINQKNRTITYLSGILFIFACAFIAWLILEITHPAGGWFQW